MRLPTKDELKNLNIKISLSILMIFSLFIFVRGLYGNAVIEWWGCLIVGWAGLAICIKLSSIVYPGKNE